MSEDQHKTTEKERRLAMLKTEYFEAITRRDRARDVMMREGTVVLRLEKEIAEIEGARRA